VLLADDGPKLIDFGIARAFDETALTHTGGVLGAPPPWTAGSIATTLDAPTPPSAADPRPPDSPRDRQQRPGSVHLAGGEGGRGTPVGLHCSSGAGGRCEHRNAHRPADLTGGVRRR
jgi:hypothetical protein